MDPFCQQKVFSVRKCNNNCGSTYRRNNVFTAELQMHPRNVSSGAPVTGKSSAIYCDPDVAGMSALTLGVEP